MRKERERTSRPGASSAAHGAPRAQESNKAIGAGTDKATGKQPESKKIETRKKAQPEIGNRMDQQASESCKMSGGNSAARQQEQIGVKRVSRFQRWSARGGGGGVTLPSPCYACAS